MKREGKGVKRKKKGDGKGKLVSEEDIGYLETVMVLIFLFFGYEKMFD